MFKHLFCILPLSLLTVLLVSCSDPAPKATPVTVEEPSGPVRKTTGVLEFHEFPLDSVTEYEVFVVSELSAEGLARLKRQRELLEGKLRGVQAVAPVENDLGLSPVDYATLNAKVMELNKTFPPVLQVDVKMENGRMRKFSSDSDKHKEYAYLFNSIRLENLEKALNFINEKYEADGEALVAKAEELEGEAYEIEKVTLDWLALVAKHLSAYLEVAKEYGAALQANASGAPVEPSDWAGYIAYHRGTLIIDVSQFSLGSVMLEQPGPFEVEGHGTVVVRLGFGLDSAYLVVSEEEPLVSVKNLQQVVVE